MSMTENSRKAPRGGLFSLLSSSITAKLVISLALLAVVPLAVAWFLINRSSSSELLAQTGRSTQEVAVRTADLIAQTIAENINLLETLTVSDDVRNQLSRANQSYGSDQQANTRIKTIDDVWKMTMPAARSNIVEAQQITSSEPSTNPAGRLLQNFKKRFPQNTEILLTDKYGALVSATRITSDYNQREKSWWKESYNNGAGAIYMGKPGLERGTGTVVLSAAVPVRGNSNEVIGVLVSTLDLQKLTDVLASVKLGRTGRTVIADSDGIILFDPARQPDLATKLPGFLTHAGVVSSTDPGWTQTVAFAGEDSIVGYARPTRTFDMAALENLQWTTVVAIQSQEALAPIAASIRYQLILGVFVAILAVAVAFFLAKRLIGQINHILELFKEIRIGNYTARAPVTTEDELGQMTTDLNSMLDETLVLIQSKDEREELQRSIMKLLDEVSGVAEGDLTVEAEVTADVTGAIADAFNYMTTELRRIITQVQGVALQVNSSATDIQTAATQLSEGSQSQSQQIVQTSAAINEMAGSIQQVSENATVSATIAEQALRNAQQGAEAVGKTINGMNRIREQVQQTSERIRQLGERSEQIGEIVRLISSIARRTSILALNSSIQAALAGEAGQGFAVVAQEVEQLAARSNEAAKQVGTVITAIQTETYEVVAAMEGAMREVTSGSQVANEAGNALKEIQQVSNRLAELIQSISLAARQQARGSESLARAMTDIASFTQETAGSTTRVAVSISDLTDLANNLSSSMSRFRVASNGKNGNGHHNGNGNGYHSLN